MPTAARTLEASEVSNRRRYVVRHPHWPETIRKPALVDMDAAVRWNRRYARELGWGKHRRAIHGVLTSALNWPAITSEPAFAMALAQWQMRQDLTVDGRLGPKTWRRMRARLCLAYDHNEKERSRTATGHLRQDVRMHNGRLLIADFAVGSSAVKPSTRAEPLLREWLQRLERGDYRLNVLGFTDCVGEEKDNETLRQARAAAVAKLLGPRTRARIDFVGSSKRGAYVAGNLDAGGRAMNRSVMIEFKRDIAFEPEPVRVKPPSLQDVVANCRQAIARQKELGIELGSTETKRILCWLQAILDPNVDDRYVPIAKWEAGSYYLLRRIDPRFFEQWFVSRLRDDVRRLHPSEPKRQCLAVLQGLDEQIGLGITKAHRLEYPAGGGSSVSAGDRQIHDWIARQGRRSRSIYHCFS
jgi:outer membrane protein OmpA-like peptidoglycan-associated protein